MNVIDIHRRQPFRQELADFRYLIECAKTAQNDFDAWKTLPEAERFVTALILNQPRWLESLERPVPQAMAFVRPGWLSAAWAVALVLEANKADKERHDHDSTSDGSDSD